MKKKTYTWEDVTISQYHEIVAIADMKISPLDKTLNFLSVMSGKEVDYYLDLPLDQVKEEIKSIEFITHTKAHPRLKDGGIYTIDETRYRLTLNARQMTAGQFIDYENTIESNPGDIAMLCAVFCVPDGKKYGEGYDPLDVKEIFFNKFKMVDAMGISFFFKRYCKHHTSIPYAICAGS